MKSDLWAHDNLVAWCVGPFDAKTRTPQERAHMLAKLGFKYYGYLWFESHVDQRLFGDEICAIKESGLEFLSWWFPFEADDPDAKETLETFKRHSINPCLWVMQSKQEFPSDPQQWANLLPERLKVPGSKREMDAMTAADRAQIVAEIRRVSATLHKRSLTKTPQEQERRVAQEAQRIKAIADLAAPYASQVALYNHNGWFGLMDNQVAIIDRLNELGVRDVGIVYNFSHARDELHDDTLNFQEVWRRIAPYTIAVNVTGTAMEGTLVYPGEGDRELAMMQTIEASGWRGRIGLIAEKGGDAEVTLRNYITGLDWLTGELRRPGSGGKHPHFHHH